MKFLRLLGILAGIILGIVGFVTSGSAAIFLWIVAGLSIIQGIPQVVDTLKKPREKPVELSEESTKRIVEAIRRQDEEAQQMHEFLDGLPTTDNEELRRFFEKGQQEEARASKIAEAIRQGDEEAAKQYAQATMKAIESYKKGLTANPKTTEKCALISLIAGAHYRLSELDQAIAHWEEAARLAEESIFNEDEEISNEGSIALASATGNLGAVHRIHGDLTRAKEMYIRALELLEELGAKHGMAGQYGNLGNVYRVEGDLGRAEEMCLRALSIFEELGAKHGMAKQYGNLGVLYQQKGDSIKAEGYYRQALQLFQEIGAVDKIQWAQERLREIGAKP